MAKQNNSDRGSSWGYFGKILGLNVFIIVAILLVLIMCLSAWLNSYTRHSEHIDVPSLQGVLVDEAIQYLDSKGLKALVIDSVYADQRPGSVVEQLPAAGLPVKRGRIVYLTINALGVRMVKMQDVLDGGSRQAFSTLRSLGFVVDSVRQVASDKKDLVLSVTTGGVEMIPGREYPVGTRVVVHVGNPDLEIEAENEETEESWLE